MAGTTTAEEGLRPPPEDTSSQDVAPIPCPPVARFARPGAAVAALAALALAMHEVSNLASGFVTDVGDHTSPGMLASPWARSESVHWNDTLTGTLVDGREPQVVWSQLVALFQVLDLAFVAVYTLGLLALARGRRWGRRLVIALATVDVLENVSHLVLAAERCPTGCVPQSWIDVSVILTWAKWGLFVVLLVAGAAAAVRAGRLCWDRLRDLLSAVWEQRFGLLAFLPIAALSVLPLGRVLSDMFDQLPDVQRRWLDGWGELRDLVCAAVVFLVVWLAILFLCRIRADWAVRREHRGAWWPNYDDPGERHPRRLSPVFWFGGPVLLLAAAGVAAATGGDVHWARFVAFTAVPVAVGAASLALGARRDLRPPGQRRAPREGFGRDVMAVGDVITAAVASLVGLGAVRAFTGPVALSWWGLLDLGTLRAVGQWVMLLGGAVAAVAAWPLTHRLLTALAVGAQAPPEIAASRASLPPATGDEPAGAGGRGRRLEESLSAKVRAGLERRLRKQDDPVELRVLLPGFDPPPTGVRGVERDTFVLGGLAWSTAIFLLLCAFPRGVAEVLGALASATLAAGMLALMMGFLVAYAQEHQPPELFQALRLPGGDGRDWRVRTTPIIALFVLATSASAWLGGSTDVHAVRSDSATVPARPPMEAAFDAWLADPRACVVPYEDDRFRVRPMLIFAAEGGGIRATYWTAAALDRIAYPGTGDRSEAEACGRHSAFFSAGASGGAVGLTVARFTDEPRAAASRMAAPDALGAASVGLLAGDLMTFGSGIRFGSPAEHRTPPRQAADRAGLMEATWEDLDGLDDLRTTFVTQDPGQATGEEGAVTGQLVLVTSNPLDGCRALLSQMRLAGPAGSDDGWPVCGGTEAGNDSFDLLSTYGTPEGAPSGDADTEHCLGDVRAFTAGLLASRFPYVTPSGVVGPCDEMKPLQLIDGGYTDNSGLGTIVDLAPQWTALVRDHNDAVLRQESGDLVVPMVVFLENGSGDDYTVTDVAAADVTRADVTAEKAAEEARGGSGLAWPRGLDVPEALIPPLGYLTAKNHHARALATLELAGDEVESSLCSGSGPSCSALRASEHARIGLYVVHQTPQPSMAAPLGWVLSRASVAEMDEDLCVSEDTSSNLLAERGETVEEYGTLHDVLLALGLPARSPCRESD